MAGRWDGDDRGRGAADARRLVPGANELVAALAEEHWVAEDPDLHLRPHIEAWCGQDDRLALVSAAPDADGAYVVSLRWSGEPAGTGAVRAAVFSLVGSFAESATYVRQRREPLAADDAGHQLRFEVGTGELSSDAGFGPHGHVVVIEVATRET